MVLLIYMLTEDDYKKLLQFFPTKEEVRQELQKIREEMATKDDFRTVMTVLDKVLKEVLAMRQEQTMHVEDHRRIDTRLDILEHPSVA